MAEEELRWRDGSEDDNKFGEGGSKRAVEFGETVHDDSGSKRAVEFGDAVHDDAGSRLTTVSTDDIFFELPTAPDSEDPLAQMGKGSAMLMGCRTCGKNGDHWTAQCPYKDIQQPSTSEDPLAEMGKGGATLMACGTCGKEGDHWTAQCPYKDILQPSGSFTDKPAPSETNAAVGVITEGAYVPPSKKGGASASEDMGEPGLLKNSQTIKQDRQDHSHPLVADFFMIYKYKVDPCPMLTNHDMEDMVECGHYHSQADRRRSPAFNSYGYTRCRAGLGLCARGDECPRAHNDLEVGLHPLIYRTQFCRSGVECRREVCFFAHNSVQRRTPGYTILPAEPLLQFPIYLPTSFPFGPGGLEEGPRSYNEQEKRLKDFLLQQNAEQ